MLMVCCTKLTVLVAERLLPPQLLLRCSNSAFCTHYSPSAQSNIESLKCNTAAPNAEPVASRPCKKPGGEISPRRQRNI